MTRFDPSSREAEAQAEIAATRIAPGVAWALLASLLALLASAPIAELAAVARGDSALAAPLPAPATGGVLAAARGAIAEIEARFDERSAWVRAVRPPSQAALVRLARYGNERVLVGRDGWLFFRDDIEHLISARPAASFAGDSRTAIVDFRDQLLARGISLVLLPTPLKPTIHPDRLTTGAASAPLRRSGEAKLVAALRADGVEVIDLAERFARDAELGELYLATDTHWRPRAVEIAAREVALRIRELTDLPPGDPAFRVASASPRDGRGDIAAMLELPATSRALLAEEVSALERSPGAPRWGGPGGAAVLLLGDSFAGIYGSSDLGWGVGAGLPDRLEAQLGLPVDRLVRNAGGASATRFALADAWRRDPSRFDDLRIVVWQFAARELSQGDWRRVPLPARISGASAVTSGADRKETP